MNFLVACNWDRALLQGLKGTATKTLFGSIPNSFMPGGRASMLIADVKEQYVEEYIKECHSLGLEFNYLLNGSCMDNLEYTKQGYREIMKFLEWLERIQVDAVTITLPFLMELVIRHFPRIKVEVSSYQKVDTVMRAKRFEDMGVSSIMLSEHVNRDFKTLEQIRKNIDCELIVMGNIGCLYGCPSLFSHANLQSHASQANHCTEGFVADGYMLTCTTKRLMHPVELIRSRWIRPEDVHHYEAIGINTLKILERRCSTEALLERVHYYSQRKYSGNLINLLGQMPNKKAYLQADFPQIMREEHADVVKLLKAMSALENVPMADIINVDNDKIPENFLEYFKNIDCNTLSCDKCKYCDRIAEQAITTKQDLLAKVRKQFRKINDSFVMGDVFGEDRAIVAKKRRSH